MTINDLESFLKRHAELIAEARHAALSNTDADLSLEPEKLIAAKEKSIERAIQQLEEVTSARDAAMARYNRAVEDRQAAVELLKQGLEELRHRIQKNEPGHS